MIQREKEKLFIKKGKSYVRFNTAILPYNVKHGKLPMKNQISH